MQIRNAKTEDIEDICKVFEIARDSMRKSGNTVQWQDGYPECDIPKDIKDGTCYVSVDENKIVAVFSFFTGEESTYKEIFDGDWLNDEPYGVVHKLAVAVPRKGVATFCLNWCRNQFSNIKIDTHELNFGMQKTATKNGFKYCGIIHKPDGTTRLAYQIE